MSGKTNIEWTDTTWNPVSGCSKVSPGCAHCYAETVTQRYAGRPGWPAEFLPWTPPNAVENVVLHPERLDAPLHWRKPRRVFVNSMSDLFHENVLMAFIAEVFAVMALTPQHTYQVLTKRPKRMLDVLQSRDFLSCMKAATLNYQRALDRRMEQPGTPWALPLPNVHLGVSVENQHWADERIPLLLQTPAAVRFISAEPLLGPVSLYRIAAMEGPYIDWLRGEIREVNCGVEGLVGRFKGLDWVIAGGESGAKRRPCELDWLRSLRDQCQAAGVPYFCKQLGGARPGGAALLDGREWREFPGVLA